MYVLCKIGSISTFNVSSCYCFFDVEINLWLSLKHQLIRMACLIGLEPNSNVAKTDSYRIIYELVYSVMLKHLLSDDANSK